MLIDTPYRTISSFLYILIICTSSYLFGQNVILSGGPNFGGLYDLTHSEGHHLKDYSSEFGYCFALTFSDLHVDSVLNPKFTVGLEQYGGGFYTSDGGLGGNTSESGNFKKQVLFLHLYPAILKISKNLIFSPGIGFNYMISNQLNGNRDSWSISDGASSYPLSAMDGFIPRWNAGLTAALTYNWHIGKFTISPIYHYYLGLTQEFRRLQSPAKSQRHSLQLGFGYHF